MEFSLHRLKLLCELERRGTVTAAAASLSYTVSAVSQQLTLLEKEAGIALFEKSGRKIVLTDAGVVLVAHARQILEAVEDAGQAMESARGNTAGTLTAGVWASVAATLLPEGIRVLSQRYPAVAVRTRELAPEDTVGAVRDGSLDMAFVIDYSSYPMPWAPQLLRKEIAVESMHAALPAKFSRGGSVNLSDLADQDWILSGPRSHFGRAVRLACRESGFDPRVRHEVGEQSTALAMVDQGLGVTLVSDLGLTHRGANTVIVDIDGPFTRTISIAYRARDNRRKTLRAFIAAMTDAAENLGLSQSEVA